MSLEFQIKFRITCSILLSQWNKLWAQQIMVCDVMEKEYRYDVHNSVVEAHNSMLVLHDSFSELIGSVNAFFMGPRKPYDREIYDWYRCIRVRS